MYFNVKTSYKLLIKIGVLKSKFLVYIKKIFVSGICSHVLLSQQVYF